MSEKEKKLLLDLLNKLQDEQICKEQGCVLSDCPYGINGHCGGECAIYTVMCGLSK